MKLSKNQIKKHQQAEELLKKDVLSFQDKIFVLENWNESAKNINSFAGAFFTPIGLARDFTLSLYENINIVDMCAGIGTLSFFAYHLKKCKPTCIELNPDYVRVGKKILPEANWINLSIMDEFIFTLPKFEQAISNPPFGNIKSGKTDYNGYYKGSEFEYIVIDIASKIADEGSFILPQLSTPFKFSGNNYFQLNEPSSKLSKFLNETGLEMQLSSSIDTEFYLNDWNGVKPICEVIDINFKERKNIKDELIPSETNFNYSKGEWAV